MKDEIRLDDLRPGAIFVTHDGIYAVKSEYHNDDGRQPQCILLASGEYASFPGGRQTLVREVSIQQEDSVALKAQQEGAANYFSQLYLHHKTSAQYTSIESAIQLLTGMILNLRTELLVVKQELVNLNARLVGKEENPQA